MDRLPHARGVVKSKGRDHIGLFQLGISDPCSERVQALMLSDQYIYPGKWGIDDKNKVCFNVILFLSNTDLLIGAYAGHQK